MHCKNVRFIQCLLTEHVQKNSKTKIPPSLSSLTFVEGLLPSSADINQLNSYTN